MGRQVGFALGENRGPAPTLNANIPEVQTPEKTRKTMKAYILYHYGNPNNLYSNKRKHLFILYKYDANACALNTNNNKTNSSSASNSDVRRKSSELSTRAQTFEGNPQKRAHELRHSKNRGPTAGP